MGKRVKQPEHIQEPQNHHDYNHAIKRIDLIDPCIGIKRLIAQRSTPTTTRTSTSWIKGMILTFLEFRAAAPLRQKVRRPFASKAFLGSSRDAVRFAACTGEERQWLDVAAST